MAGRARKVAAFAVTAVLAAGIGAAVTAAANSAADSSRSYDATRRVLQRLTSQDGAPGALVEVSGRSGNAVLTSGVADTSTGAPVVAGSRFRIGSMTKMFTATVVLQLVAERKVALDAPVERYLPGVIRGNENDGRQITVRQVLQHTSGLPDYLKYVDPQTIVQHPLEHHDPIDVLDLALAHRRVFEPGKSWGYSNTNYLVAAMIIERVTGHRYATEMNRRIIEPLGLRDTSAPYDDPDIAGPHPHGYVKPGDTDPIDITRFNPSIAFGAGSMISSGHDVNRFLSALLAGRLLPPSELKAMMHTRSTGQDSDRAYGLGLQSMPLDCGGQYWGHDGDVMGFETVSGATGDGRQVTVMATLDPGGTDAQDTDLQKTLTTALCEAE